MLGDRLFYAFDNKKNNVIEFDEFLRGMALCIHGNLEEKYNLIFDMYNLAGDEGVSREELAVMMNSVLQNSSRVAAPDAQLPGIQEQHQSLNGTVQDIVKSAFANRGPMEKLSFEDFKQWSASNPIVLESVFNNRYLQKYAERLLQDVTLRTAGKHVDPETYFRGALMRGPLWTGSKHSSSGKTKPLRSLKRRYSVVWDDFLYSYKMHDDGVDISRPKSAVFLGGCFIKANDQTDLPKSPSKRGGLFGIQIDFNYGDPLRLYATDVPEQQKWIEAMSKAGNARCVHDAYEFGEVLGKGCFASVYEATSRDTEIKVAIKKIVKTGLTQEEKATLFWEIACHKVASHPNIVGFIDVFEDADAVYLVEELLSGPDLQTFLLENGLLDEATCKLVFGQLLSAIAHLHEIGIVHRDLKPSNVMFSSRSQPYCLKIVDFGYSKFVIPTQQLTELVGTVKYFAPELIMNQPYDKSVDMWAAGVLLYMLLTGMFPFAITSTEETMQSISSARYLFLSVHLSSRGLTLYSF